AASGQSLAAGATAKSAAASVTTKASTAAAPKAVACAYAAAITGAHRSAAGRRERVEVAMPSKLWACAPWEAGRTTGFGDWVRTGLSTRSARARRTPVV